MEAVTAAKEKAGNGTNGTNGTNATSARRHSSQRFLLGVVGSARRAAAALTSEQLKEKEMAGCPNPRSCFLSHRSLCVWLFQCRSLALVIGY